MKALTIRDVDPALARALEREKRLRGTSLNQTVLDLLRQALGTATSSTRSNGLARLSGGWSQEELEEFERSTALFERVDDDIWS